MNPDKYQHTRKLPIHPRTPLLASVTEVYGRRYTGFCKGHKVPDPRCVYLSTYPQFGNFQAIT